MEIQGDDPALGLPDYAAITDRAIGEHRDVMLVAQSMGAFTVPMISKRDALARIVLLNAMIPAPGEWPCTFEAWPDVPIHVLVGADDRSSGPPSCSMLILKAVLSVGSDVVEEADDALGVVPAGIEVGVVYADARTAATSGLQGGCGRLREFTPAQSTRHVRVACCPAGDELAAC